MKNLVVKTKSLRKLNGTNFRPVREGVAALFLVAFLALSSGCAVQSVEVKGESSESKVTKSVKIAVVENPSLDSFVSSGELKEELTGVLKQQGFQVVSSENEADLVALPLATILSSEEQAEGDGRSVRGTSNSFLFRSGFDEVGDTSVSRRLGISTLDSHAGLLKSRVGMSVTAISKEAWLNMKPEEPLPIVWRVIATADLTRGKEIQASKTLLVAMGEYFGKNTGGFVQAKVDQKNN